MEILCKPRAFVPTLLLHARGAHFVSRTRASGRVLLRDRIIECTARRYKRIEKRTSRIYLIRVQGTLSAKCLRWQKINRVVENVNNKKILNVFQHNKMYKRK